MVLGLHGKVQHQNASLALTLAKAFLARTGRTDDTMPTMLTGTVSGNYIGAP